jgi:hypothetical protein
MGSIIPLSFKVLLVEQMIQSAILIWVGIILGEGGEGMMMSIFHIGKCQRGFVAINLI